MWRVLYDDGIGIDDQNTYWTELPKDKPISKVTLFSGNNPFIGRELSGMDKYYYVKEAITTIGVSSPSKHTIVAEIIGGVNLIEQTIEELRYDCQYKSITSVIKPLSEYKYSEDILLPGKK